MQCPKCKHFMKTIQYEGVSIERCTRCYGMWFDHYEVEDLKQISGSEVIDIGDVELGSEQNKNMHALCPKCQTIMLSETDEKQKHIRFERCPDCQGVYFDAGEYRDYKSLTIQEFFKSIFNRNA